MTHTSFVIAATIGLLVIAVPKSPSAAHAQTEEEILYPAAILVGDIIRARTSR